MRRNPSCEIQSDTQPNCAVNFKELAAGLSSDNKKEHSEASRPLSPFGNPAVRSGEVGIHFENLMGEKLLVL